MKIYCANCAHALCTTVSSFTKEGIPIYHMDRDARITHKVRCKKGWWKTKTGREWFKTLVTLRTWRLESCDDYKPMDAVGAVSHRLSLPENLEEYRERWLR